MNTATAVAISSFYILFSLSAIAQPSLRITSLAEGTVFHPGESVPVTVAVSPPTGGFQGVFVEGAEPIGLIGQMLKAPPYEFVIHLPSKITPGEYPLTAYGSTSPGHLVMSDPVVIVVEPSTSPASLDVQPSGLDLYLDQKGYLQVYGKYADGTTADLTKSTSITFTSADAAIARVQPQGIVTPVAAGATKIVITYRGLRAEVPVTVRGRTRR